MFRKQSSYGKGRRSSVPKRLSSAVEADEKNRNASDGKRLVIPRPITISSRSSSAERNLPRNSARVSSKHSRNNPADIVYSDDHHMRVSHFRARSHENLTTPSHAVMTPSASECRALSVPKTLKKDPRPLSERVFQLREVIKVREYLIAHNITPELGRDLQGCMTLKLFVHIMNSLLQDLFPMHTLTLSNYCELIPMIMRKLKYPGNITRSWLVTVNSSHSWSAVLGLFSWLVDLLSFHVSSDLKFIVDMGRGGDDDDDDDNDDDDDGDGDGDNERMAKLFAYNTQKYIDWSENDSVFSCEEDQQFFDELIMDQRKPLEECLTQVQKEVQKLQEIIHQKIPESNHIEGKLNFVKEELDKKRTERNNRKEKVCTLQNSIEKKIREKHLLDVGNENLRKRISEFLALNTLSENSVKDVMKLQSEVASLKSIIKLQDPHITDISNQCYASDLTNARLQGKLDELRLHRDALLRGCTSHYVDSSIFHLTLTYGNEDNSSIMTKYFAQLKNAKQCTENILKEFSERQTSGKMQLEEAEEKFKMLKEENSIKLLELKNLDEEVTERRKLLAELKIQMSTQNEEFSKKEEMQFSLEHALEIKIACLSDLRKELQSCNDSFLEQKALFSRILKRMIKEVNNNINRCKKMFASNLK